MRGQLFFAATAVLAGSSAFGEDNHPTLTIQFNAAPAVIAPRPSNAPIQLPNLTFAVQAQAYCPTAENAASVAVSIADTRITITPESNDLIEVEIQVPAKQLGPVVATDFCLDGETDDGKQLELEGALSAQISLRCKTGNGDTISYRTAPLNIALQCRNPE